MTHYEYESDRINFSYEYLSYSICVITDGIRFTALKRTRVGEMSFKL